MLGLSCGMWDLVPWPGIEPRPPSFGVWSLSHWTTREVLQLVFSSFLLRYPSLVASLVAQMVKRLSAMRETRVQFLGREDPLEKEMAIHSSTLAWKIPRMEEPDRLQSMGPQRVGLDWETSLSLSFKTIKHFIKQAYLQKYKINSNIF